MWFDGERQPNTIYIANTSRGKDSTAMLKAIQLLGWPLDAICSIDIWFNETIPAELPPMVAFKDEYDKKVLEYFGIPVTRICARNKDGSKRTYCDVFYKELPPGDRIMGFPMLHGNWCQHLKRDAAVSIHRIPEELKDVVAQRVTTKAKVNYMQYIGIAADETKRIKKHINKRNEIMPLVQIGWDEGMCYLETLYMDMLAPTYINGSRRDGCWFCNNQTVGNFRKLKHDYPELWNELLILDDVSPVKFNPHGQSVRDFDLRFQMEDDGRIDTTKPFHWKQLVTEQDEQRGG